MWFPNASKPMGGEGVQNGWAELALAGPVLLRAVRPAPPGPAPRLMKEDDDEEAADEADEVDDELESSGMATRSFPASPPEQFADGARVVVFLRAAASGKGKKVSRRGSVCCVDRQPSPPSSFSAAKTEEEILQVHCHVRYLWPRELLL